MTAAADPALDNTWSATHAGTVQIVEVTGFGVRSSVIRLRSTGGSAFSSSRTSTTRRSGARGAIWPKTFELNDLPSDDEEFLRGVDLILHALVAPIPPIGEARLSQPSAQSRSGIAGVVEERLSGPHRG